MKRTKLMNNKKLYILAVTVLIILLVIFLSRYERGIEVGTWGMNRSINW